MPYLLRHQVLLFYTVYDSKRLWQGFFGGRDRSVFGEDLQRIRRIRRIRWQNAVFNRRIHWPTQGKNEQLHFKSARCPRRAFQRIRRSGTVYVNIAVYFTLN
jgi:hypothetical protein